MREELRPPVASCVATPESSAPARAEALHDGIVSAQSWTEIAAASSVILVIVTAVYVVLTFSMARSSRRQLSLQSLPVLDASIKLRKSHHVLEIANYSNASAFFTDVTILAGVDTDELGIEEFKAQYLEKPDEELREEFSAVDEGLYWLRDKSYHATIPGSRRVALDLYFPVDVPFELFYVWIQNTTAAGEVYGQLFWFHSPGSGTHGLQREVVTRMPQRQRRIFHYPESGRLLWRANLPENLLTRLGSWGRRRISSRHRRAPRYIRGETLETLRASLSVGFLRGTLEAGWSDRGTTHPLDD